MHVHPFTQSQNKQTQVKSEQAKGMCCCSVLGIAIDK